MLKNEMTKKRSLLSNYFCILEEEKIPIYLQTKYIKVNYDKKEKTKALWEKHDNALDEIQLSEALPNQSLFDLKIELANRVFKNCCFCERKCGIDRNKKAGFCDVKEANISSEFLHMGEEDVLVPSHTIFFSGCTFNCVFCQNWDISQQKSGLYVNPKKLVEIIVKRKYQGSKNVNWVGGDPTSNVYYILSVLKKLDVNISQIWNSNMYCSLETMKLLDGIIDLYLTDFKYGNNECAERLSKVKNYFEILTRNHKKIYENSEMIIRHLVMPNHVDCCSKPIIDWISENIPSVLVNIMGQYRPTYHANQYQDISRNVYLSEVNEIKEYAENKDIFLL
jgi:putative pyruvate formate lyase activating enzyme